MHFSDRLLQETGAQEGSKHDWNETQSRSLLSEANRGAGRKESHIHLTFLQSQNNTFDKSLKSLHRATLEREGILKLKHFILISIIHLGVASLLVHANEHAIPVNLLQTLFNQLYNKL